MTTQIQDAFQLRGKSYSLVNISGNPLFEPSRFGLWPVARSSACWSGYQCTYGIVEGHLVLAKLLVNLPSRAGVAGGPQGPEIHGRRPTPLLERLGFFSHVYEGLDLPISFSGGLLLADSFVRDIGFLGFTSTWMYSEVLELVVKDGVVQRELNCSEQVAEVRSLILANPNPRVMWDHPPEIVERLHQAFSCRYAW